MKLWPRGVKAWLTVSIQLDHTTMKLQVYKKLKYANGIPPTFKTSINALYSIRSKAFRKSRLAHHIGTDHTFSNTAKASSTPTGGRLWLWLCACMSEGSPLWGARYVRPKHQLVEQNLTKSYKIITQLHPQRRILRKARKSRVCHEFACPIVPWVLLFVHQSDSNRRTIRRL